MAAAGIVQRRKGLAGRHTSDTQTFSVQLFLLTLAVLIDSAGESECLHCLISFEIFTQKKEIQLPHNSAAHFCHRSDRKTELSSYVIECSLEELN